MIYFLIPTFNEAANIANLYQDLASRLPNEPRCFVFSDDGSTDDTRALIGHTFGQVRHTILTSDVNRGPGYAFNAGFEWILSDSTDDQDMVVTMEADCTSDTELLGNMVGLNRMGFDLVLASVYAQGGGFEKTSLAKKVLSTVANLLFRFIFDLRVQTLSSFYRVYSIDLLRRVKKRYPVVLKEPGFICMLEMLMKCVRSGARVIEVPMMLRSSKRMGQSKMKLLQTSLAYFKFLWKYSLSDRDL